MTQLCADQIKLLRDLRDGADMWLEIGDDCLVSTAQGYYDIPRATWNAWQNAENDCWEDCTEIRSLRDRTALIGISAEGLKYLESLERGKV